MTDADNQPAHLLVLEILRWQRRNKVSTEGIDELLRLLRPFLADEVDNYPTSTHKAWSNFKSFIKVLDIHTVEICENGCHRFPEGSDAESCPLCGTNRKADDGTLTTCTFTFFDLKEKLRLLFARPNYVPLLTSYANHEPDHQRMRSVHGACYRNMLYLLVVFAC